VAALQIIADVADEILSRIPDCPDIVGAGYLCKTFNEAAISAKKVRYVFRASQNEEQPMPTIWLGMAKDLLRRVSPGSTLQDLCIIHYGQQAIVTTTSILEILSRNCEFSISYVASVLVLLWKCFSSCIARKFKLHSQLFPTPLVCIADPNTWTCIEHSFTLLLLLFFWFGSQARDWRQLI
jgi:hypothetical protein